MSTSILSKEEVGLVARDLREAAGLTQEQLAQRARVPVATLRNLEQGRSSPAWRTIAAVAHALGVSFGPFSEPPRETVPRPRGRPKKPG